MTKSILQAFSTGEISPELSSSTELEKQRTGLRRCSNMTMDVLGGVKNAPGTEYITDAYETTKLSRLIPFQFNNEQAYVLEFGDERLRVFKDSGLVLLDIVDTSLYRWELSGAGVDEYLLTEVVFGLDPKVPEPQIVLEDGTVMQRAVLGSLLINQWGYGDNDAKGYDTIYVRITSGLDPDSKATGYLQTPVLVVSPYPEEDVQALDSTSSADTIFLFHGDYNIRKLTRGATSTGYPGKMFSWPINEFPSIDGPYKPRVAGNIDVRINAKFISGTTWEFTSDTEIFADVEVGEPWRIGLPIPGDVESIHWTWYVVSTVTSDTVIRADLQEESRPAFQQVTNALFETGTEFWTDLSTPLIPPFASTLSYDFTNQAAVLTDGAGGDAIMEQAVLTFANVKNRLAINVHTLSTGTAQVTLKVGTASGLSDIYLSPILTATGPHAATILPTQEIIYISFTTNGSADADVVKIDQVELFAVGDEPAGGTEYNTTDWRLAAWNSTHGYPQKGIIHEQRLVCAGNKAEPQTIWVSELGNFESFASNTPTRPTDSFSFLPSTTEINGIDWLLLQNGLKVGTSDSIWKVFAASGGAITPTDVNIDIDNAVGTLDLKPIKAGNSIIMTPRGFTAVTELTSSLEVSGHVPRDISILANHLFRDRRIIRWGYAMNPDSIIWCILDNGLMLGMTYIKEYDLWAWYTRSTPLGEGFKDIAVIPNSSDDNADDVYFVVNRADVGETPNYYIEILSRRIIPQEAAFGLASSGTPYDYRFLDSAATYDNPNFISNATKTTPVLIVSDSHGYSDGDLVRIQNAVGMTELNNNIYVVTNKTANNYEIYNQDGIPIAGIKFGTYLGGGESRLMEDTLTGLDHLEGQTVTALADGAVESGLEVSGGQITLSQKASFAHIGLPYVSQIETVDLEMMFNTGSTQGRLKSFTKLDVYFKDTRNAEFQATSFFDQTKWWKFKFEDEAFGEDPPPLFTGSKEEHGPGNYEKEERIRIRQVDPLPIHIKRIIPDADYGG